LFSGVAAVVGAVAFQMDQVLRPVLSPLTKAFFGLSDAIFNLDGAAGDAVGIIGSIITAIVGIGGTIAAVAVQIFGFSTVWGAVSSAVTGAVSAIVGVIGGIPLAIATAIAAIVGFAVAYLTNFKGVRDTTNEIIGNVVDTITTGFDNVTETLATWAGNLASDMFAWGKQAIQRFIDGLKSLIDRVRNILSDLGTDVRVALGGDASVDNGRTGGGSSNPMMRGASAGGGSITLDGRDITEDTGRYRSDPSRRRGI